MGDARVLAVCAKAEHGVRKLRCERIELVAGKGVKGDAHFGEKVKHRSRVAQNPDQPNLRQVHLIHGELLDELRERGFSAEPGVMGENITTRGLDLLGLPTGALLSFGGDDGALVEITGLRNPCEQLDGLAPGWMAATVERGDEGELIRKAGVMGVVRRSGVVAQGDPIYLRKHAVGSGRGAPLRPV